MPDFEVQIPDYSVGGKVTLVISGPGNCGAFHIHEKDAPASGIIITSTDLEALSSIVKGLTYILTGTRTGTV